MKQERLYDLGLALGGGGTRGFAHLGVLTALYDAGIKPDIISGTSAGSIVGIMLAAGKTPKQCMNFFNNLGMLDLTRPTISKKGLMTMNSLEQKLTDFIGKRNFKDLKIPLIVTASNLETAEYVHFERGDAVSAVIASSSVPIVFQPYNIDGIDYVDGGVFMNLPVRPIRPCCKHIIAIEINSVPTNKPLNNMIDIASRSFSLGVKQNTRIDRRMADIVISPKNLTEYSIFDLTNKDIIFERGLKAGKAAVNKILDWK